MLKAIRDFFEGHLALSDRPSAKRHTLELATATLLAEVMRLEGVEPAWRVAYADATLSAHGCARSPICSTFRIRLTSWPRCGPRRLLPLPRQRAGERGVAKV